MGARRLPRTAASPLRPASFTVLRSVRAHGDAKPPAPRSAGRTLVVVFFAVTTVVGAWLEGQWTGGDLDQASVHPGYYLPTVAGGLVGVITLSQVHLRGLAEAILLS